MQSLPRVRVSWHPAWTGENRRTCRAVDRNVFTMIEREKASLRIEPAGTSRALDNPRKTTSSRTLCGPQLRLMEAKRSDCAEYLSQSIRWEVEVPRTY